MNTTFNGTAYLPMNKYENARIFKGENDKRTSFLRNKAYISALCISVIITFFIICSGLIIANAAVSSEVESSQYKYYKSISIEKGDTLWSIASDYVSGPKTINNYVNELKEINNLQTDCIYQGQNLIVYYYSTESK